MFSMDKWEAELLQIVEFQATEMIEEVRRLPPCSARTEMLVEAIRLLKTGIQKINLPVICQLLYEGKK